MNRLSTNREYDVLSRIVLGAKFYYLNEYEFSKQQKIIKQWLLKFKNENDTSLIDELLSLVTEPTSVHGAVDPNRIEEMMCKSNKSSEMMCKSNKSSEMMTPFIILSPNELQMRYSGIIVETKRKYQDIEKDNIFIGAAAQLSKILTCLPTPTLVDQLSHLFGSIVTGYPLLLQGPP